MGVAILSVLLDHGWVFIIRAKFSDSQHLKLNVRIKNFQYSAIIKVSFIILIPRSKDGGHFEILHLLPWQQYVINCL